MVATSIFRKMKKYFGDISRKILRKDLLTCLNYLGSINKQQSPEFLGWTYCSLIEYTDEYVANNLLLDSHFIKSMNAAFKTTRFNQLLKRYILDYLLRLFEIFDNFSDSKQASKKLVLEDNPINRFALRKYSSRFGIMPEVRWISQPGLFSRFFNVILRMFALFYLSLKDGIRIAIKVQRHKVMREAVWGFYDVGGYYFHDDFLVDGKKIKNEDLLLFTRGVPKDDFRLKGYHDARRSPYGHFTLGALPLGLKQFICRVIPKYILCGSYALFGVLSLTNYCIFYGVFLYFAAPALQYEKVFSNYKINSELGCNCYSIRHIPESIVCQNYGVKYYLMHWSDISTVAENDKFLCSFLACDKFLLWGNAHIQVDQEDNSIYKSVGYVFKKFIKEVMADRKKILADMGINGRGKIVSFFDEPFGEECRMTAEHYVTFWDTALKFAEIEKNNTIIIKPKTAKNYLKLPEQLIKQFLDIMKKIKQLDNVYIINEKKWSFIEVIGTSDIVVTQGINSPSTIAIICGIEGLYLDQAKYNHPFPKYFKGTVVFDSPEELLEAIHRILRGESNPLKTIPEKVIREFDAYADDDGIERFRSILAS